MRGIILYKQRPGFSTPSAFGINRILDSGPKNGLELKYATPENLWELVFKFLPDFIIPRTGPYTTMADIELIRKLENLGVRSINSADCIKTTNDKYLSFLMLSKENIPVPKTYLASHNLGIIEKEIGYPIVVKPIIGAQGKGVILGENSDILKGLESKDFIIQEYIEDSRGRDIRVFTVGGKAVACVERVGAGDDFRSNYSLGGSVNPYNLTPEIKKIAESTAKALGLEIGGIDLLFSKDGFKVCEANFSPGLETIEKCYNLDIPKIIFNYIKEG